MRARSMYVWVRARKMDGRVVFLPKFSDHRKRNISIGVGAARGAGLLVMIVISDDSSAA